MRNTINIKGKQHRIFSIHAFGRDIKVILAKGNYSNDSSLAIKVYEIENRNELFHLEPFGMLTVNMGVPVGDNAQCIKTWSENEEWAEALADKIGDCAGYSFTNGYVKAPLYIFKQDVLAQLAFINDIR